MARRLPQTNPYKVNPLPLPTPFNVTRIKQLSTSTQATNQAYQQRWQAHPGALSIGDDAMAGLRKSSVRSKDAGHAREHLPRRRRHDGLREHHYGKLRPEQYFHGLYGVPQHHANGNGREQGHGLFGRSETMRFSRPCPTCC